MRFFGPSTAPMIQKRPPQKNPRMKNSQWPFCAVLNAQNTMKMKYRTPNAMTKGFDAAELANNKESMSGG